MSCSSTCTSARGPQGQDGQSQYTYIAYASNNSGAGFSLIPSVSLPYIQIITVNNPIQTLTVANFTGTWVKYIGDNGTNGGNGTAGKDGNHGSISLSYKFNTSTTASDPGFGFIKFNDTDLTGADTMYINRYEAGDGTDVGQLLLFMGNGTSQTKSIITISTPYTSYEFASYEATVALSLTGNYYTVSGLNFLSSWSTSIWGNGDDVIVSFSIAGDKGDMPSSIMYNDINAGESQGSGSWEAITDYTVAANTLSTNGSYLKITGIGTCQNPNVFLGDFESCRITVNNQIMAGMSFSYQGETVRFDIEFYRKTSTTIRMNQITYYAGGTIFTNSVDYLAPFDCTQPLTVAFEALDVINTGSTSFVSCDQLLIEKYIK